VIDGLVALVENPDLTNQTIDEVYPGAGFPYRRFHSWQGTIAQAYNEGKGIIQMRGKAFTETVKRTGKEQIVISESRSCQQDGIIEQIAALVQRRRSKASPISAMNRTAKGMRHRVELKRDAIADIVLKQLYKHTGVARSFGVTCRLCRRSPKYSS